jgi:hypothetical protein
MLRAGPAAARASTLGGQAVNPTPKAKEARSKKQEGEKDSTQSTRAPKRLRLLPGPSAAALSNTATPPLVPPRMFLVTGHGTGMGGGRGGAPAAGVAQRGLPVVNGASAAASALSARR